MDETLCRGKKADVRRGRSFFTELLYYSRVRHVVGVVCSFWEGTADRGFESCACFSIAYSMHTAGAAIHIIAYV
jgi:hypothetical protein